MNKPSFDSLAAMEAVEREALSRQAHLDDATGAFARGFDVMMAYRHWFAAEAGRVGMRNAYLASLEMLSHMATLPISPGFLKAPSPEGKIRAVEEYFTIAAEATAERLTAGPIFREQIKRPPQ